MSAAESIRSCRDEARAAPLTAAGAEVCRVDLNDRSSLRSAHDAVDAAVLQLPSGISPDATRALAANALAAIRQCDVKKIVLNSSVHFPSRSSELPQLAAKEEVERTLLDSGLQVSVIHAPFLLSNLLLPWASQSIATQGLLAYPVSRDIPSPGPLPKTSAA